MSLSPRAVITLTFFAFGAMVGSNLGALPILVKQAGLSPFQFGAMAGTAMLSNILMMAAGGYINRHFDHRSVLLLSFPLCFVFMSYAMIVQTALAYGVAVIGFNLALGAIDLMMNAEAAEIEQELKRPVFSSFHATVLYGIGIFAILSSLISTWAAPWFVCLVTFVPVALAIAAIYKILPMRPIIVHSDDKPRGKLPLRLLTFIGLAIGFDVACEVASIQWAGQLLSENVPRLAAFSGLGAAFYCAFCGTMRMFGDPLRAKFGDFAVIVTGLLISISCLVVLSFSPGFAASVAAFAGVGLGFAVLFPCLFSLAAKLAPESKAAALGYASLVGGAPRAILPWILGWLAQQFGLGAVFAASAVMAATALLIILTTFRQANAASIS
jgi:MFS family permease